MPCLRILGHNINLTDEVVAPLIAADILYWDTMGGDNSTELDHLHINPEQYGSDAIERMALAVIGVVHPEPVPAEDATD